MNLPGLPVLSQNRIIFLNGFIKGTLQGWRGDIEWKYGQSDFFSHAKLVCGISHEGFTEKNASIALFGDERICNDSEGFAATATVAIQHSSAMIEPIYQKNPGWVIVWQCQDLHSPRKIIIIHFFKQFRLNCLPNLFIPYKAMLGISRRKSKPHRGTSASPRRGIAPSSLEGNNKFCILTKTRKTTARRASCETAVAIFNIQWCWSTNWASHPLDFSAFSGRWEDRVSWGNSTYTMI